MDGETFRVEIERAHMEEDTGKSLHVGGATGRIHGADHSLVDYNRAGIPLIEIVTKPILGAGAKAPEVARAYVAQLRDLIVALGVSDARMDQGRSAPTSTCRSPRRARARLGTRTETKNVNCCGRSSARCVSRCRGTRPCSGAGGDPPGDAALARGHRRHHERSREVRRRGLPLLPQPDLVPVAPSREWVEELRATLPENPTARRRGCRPPGASPTSRCATRSAPARST